MDRKKAAILAIGNELLTGKIVNSNSQFVSKELVSLGYHVVAHHVVGDSIEEIVIALQSMGDLGISLVVTIGGLGPTLDDCTRAAVASFLKRKLETSLFWQQELSSRFGSDFPLLQNQSLTIQGGQIIDNKNGSAPGVLCTTEIQQFLLLPGPPSECRIVLEGATAFLHRPRLTTSYSFRIIGLYESDLDAILREITRNHDVEFGIYPNYGYVDLVMTRIESLEEGKKILSLIEEALKKETVKKYFILDSLIPMEKEILRLCRENKWSLAVAESCTGGAIAARLSSIPGASDVFQGGVIAYSEKVKQSLLAVSEELLDEKGAVSSEVCEQMVFGAHRLFQSNVAIATTGFFGPSGGNNESDYPVGTVFFSILSPYGKETFHFFGEGDRESISIKSIGCILSTLLLHLYGKN